MTAVSLRAAPAVERPAAPPAHPALDAMRRSGHAARLRPDPSDTLGALVCELPARLGRRMVFYERGASDMSFDEAWLLNLLDAVRRGDTDRYCFALLSRMSKADAAEIHFLVCKSAWTLDAAA